MDKLRAVFISMLVLGFVGCSSSSSDNPPITHQACEKYNLYVANRSDASVSVVDLCTNQEKKKITVGTTPSIWNYDDVNHLVFVSNADSNTVSVINTLTQTKIGNDLTVGTSPQDVAWDETNRLLYVTNAGSDSVSVFTADSNFTAFTEDAKSPLALPAGSAPHQAVVVPGTGAVYVAAELNYVYKIDPKTMTVGNTPIDLRVSGETADRTLRRMKISTVNNKIYVTRVGGSGKDRVAIIDPGNSDAVTNVQVGNGAGRLILDDAGNVYTVNNSGTSPAFTVSRVSVTDNSVTDYPVLSDKPGDIEVTPTGSKVFVSIPGANNNGNTVVAIDTTSSVVGNPVTVGTNPINTDYVDELKRLYVSNRGDETNIANAGTTVSVVDTENNLKVTDITVGKNPGSLVVVDVPLN